MNEQLLPLSPLVRTTYIPEAEFYKKSILLKEELPEGTAQGKYDFSANNRIILENDGTILVPVNEPTGYFYGMSSRKKRTALREEKEHQRNPGNRQLYVLQLSAVKKLSYHANAFFNFDANIYYSSPNVAFYRAIHADTAPVLRIDAGWLLSKRSPNF